MPTSRSPRPIIEPKPATRRWPLILIGIIVVGMASIFLLPASMLLRFLPPSVRAEDFSGSLLHGAAGRLRVNGRDAGALEWHLHPAALMHFALSADIHWVKVGFVIDGSAEVSRNHFAARGIQGGGPIENLGDFGVAPGWRGIATVNFDELSGDFSRLDTAVGKIEVANLSSAGIASGSDLGGYELQLPKGSVAPDGTVAATLTDTGGPLELRADLHLTPATRTGMLSGTLKEGPDATADLRNQLSSLAQMHARDSSGRFPVDLEFTF
jgi:Type II secretion system (T2SS), protein N